MFTTYSASAGSGKTTNLVADYLALCFRFDSRKVGRETQEFQLDLYQRILAITFTNNASSEMKDRIVKTLYAIAFEERQNLGGSASAIYNMVVKKLFDLQPDDISADMEKFMRVESRELLRRIIYDYARFTISTIDSFFQRVIRSSALSLNLNLNYTVQIDMDEFYLQAIDQLLNELSAETELASRIIFVLDNAMEDTGKMDVDKELKAALVILYDNAEKNLEFLNILSQSDQDEIRQYIQSLRKNIKEIPAVLKEKIKPYAQEGSVWLEKLGLKFKRRSFNTWFEDVQKDPIKYYITSTEEIAGSGGQIFSKAKLSDEELARIEEFWPKVEACFEKVAAAQHDLRKRYLDSVIRHRNADKVLMLMDLKKKMEEIKLQNNFFILSESNTLIYETIQSKGFETLFDRVKFDNFFIDEFQDTSKMQWEDLKPIIINNALSQFDRQVSLFGDVKQAIYRFRNGDADLFYKLLDYDRMQEDPDLRLVDRMHYNQEILDTNYRSLKSVVEFNNQFFEYYATKRGLDKYYAEGLKQKVFNNQEGQVQVCFYADKEKKNELKPHFSVEDAVWADMVADKKTGVQDLEVILAVMDARRRGYSDGDIAVLCRNNFKCAHIADIMLRMGWNVITEKSLNLSASVEVNLIIYTLRYLLHPDDKVAKSTILYYMARLQDKETMLPQYMPTLKEEGVFESLLEKEFGKPLPRNQWLSEPLFLLVKDVMRYYGMEHLQSPFVVDFENLVWQYLQSRNGELSKFLTWWQQQVELDKLPSLSLPAGQDAIRISTIHKSKGLEYPVVVFPYNAPRKQLLPVWDKVNDRMVAYVELNSSCVGSSYEERYEEESLSAEMDDLNVLYVAHTRARDMLYVLAKRSERESSAYGNDLQTFITNNIQQEEGLAFVHEEDNTRYYYLGDRNWRNPKPEVKSEVPHSIPEVVASDFELDQVQVLFETTLPEDDPRAEGTYVHDFLSGLADFPQSEDVFEQCLADVPEAKRPRLRAAYRRIMEDADLRPCFAPGVRVLNEVNILDEAHREHRPDRVAFLDDRVVVIDYKTGAPHEQYQQQIDGYCALLRNMGYQNVEGRLLYV